MASMGPHRVKVDGKKDFEHVFACKASHRKFTLSISACINCKDSLSDLWKSIQVWGELTVCVYQSLWSQKDTIMLPDQKMDVCSMTTNGTAGVRPYASTGRTNILSGVCVCVYSYEWFHKHFCPWGWFIFKFAFFFLRKKFDFFVFQGHLKMHHKVTVKTFKMGNVLWFLQKF